MPLGHWKPIYTSKEPPRRQTKVSCPKHIPLLLCTHSRGYLTPLGMQQEQKNQDQCKIFKSLALLNFSASQRAKDEASLASKRDDTHVPLTGRSCFSSRTALEQNGVAFRSLIDYPWSPLYLSLSNKKGLC